ncbi:MAG: recombinase family protein, partial [Lawsonibacter sp.]|nr:recombinase family protein [Lawsonibacter sp.]
TVVDRKPTLEIYEPEAVFVRMMFQLYAQGYGCISIARHINVLGARPHRAQEFSRTSVAKILHNPTYIGKIVWNQKKHIRKGSNGTLKHITICQPKDQWIITDGLHMPIVEPELFDRVQNILAGRFTPPRRDGTVKSALAGLIRCANCGQNMQRMSRKEGSYLLCTKAGCCASTQFDLVEERILNCLEETLAALPLPPSAPPNIRDTELLDLTLTTVQKELAAAQRQKKRLYELLELGEYDIQTFRERMETVLERISVLEQKAHETHRAAEHAALASPATLSEKIRTVLDLYTISDAAGRNALLKSIIDVIWYRKEKKARPTDFYLDTRLRSF